MEQIVKILVLWVVCGLITCVIDRNTPKLPGEDAMSVLRCIGGGPVLLTAILFVLLLGAGNGPETD